MTPFEYELAFHAVIGLAGCAMALVAMALDWRDELRHGYATGSGWSYRTTGKPGWRVGETKAADFGTQWAAKGGPLPADLGRSDFSERAYANRCRTRHHERPRLRTYKGEGLTACDLEVVGPCPECATANGERT